MSAAGLSFAFAGPAGVAADGPQPLWLLPTQAAAPVDDSYDEAMDELVEDVLVDEPTQDVPVAPDDAPAAPIDDRAARILRLRSRF